MEADLNNFNWDDSVESNLDDTTQVEENNQEENPPVEEENNLEEPQEEEENEEEENEGNTEFSIYTDLAKDLKERGFLKNIELEEAKDLTADDFYDLQSRDYEEEVNKRLEHWATQELDEDAKAFIQFKRAGGKTEDFFRVYNDSSIEEGDIEEEDFQDQIIRRQLKQDGWDDEEIDERLEILTEKGKKAALAEKYYGRMVEQQQQQREELQKRLEQQREVERLQAQKLQEELRENIKNTSEIKGIKFSDKDKEELFDMMVRPKYQTEDGEVLTGFQAKLREALSDKEKSLLLVKLLKDDFDFSSIEKKATTKKVKEIKSNLESRKNYKSSGFGSSPKGSSLADLFD